MRLLWRVDDIGVSRQFVEDVRGAALEHADDVEIRQAIQLCLSPHPARVFEVVVEVQRDFIKKLSERNLFKSMYDKYTESDVAEIWN